MTDAVAVERGTLWQWLARVFWSSARRKTDHELALEREIADLKFRLQAQEDEAERLRLENRKREADVEAARHEIIVLSEVIERNRLRVLSEQEAYAAHGGRRPQREDKA
jgi:hypothetical protein